MLACWLVPLTVGLGLLFQVLELESTYEVVVRNDTAAPLSSRRLVGGGLDLSVDEVAPGRCASLRTAK